MRVRYAKISTFKIRNILKCFSEDLPASKAAALGLNVNTTERSYNLCQEKITRHSIEEAKLSGKVELDESYFGARRVRGTRGAGRLARHRSSAF